MLGRAGRDRRCQPRALDDFVSLCVQLGQRRHHAGTGGDVPGTGLGAAHTGDSAGPGAPGPAATPAWEAQEQAIIEKAVDLLSGPGGLASFLRTQQLGARLARPSLPLDIGYAKTIPPAIRDAVILRDRRCRWPGGYFL